MNQSDQESIPGKPRSKISYITLLLGIAALVLLGIYLFQNREVFSSLKSITAAQIILIIAIETVNFLIGSYLNYLLVRRFGYQVNMKDSILLQYINSFLNKILPTIGGGAAFRAVFLKRKYGFPYSQFVSTLGGFYLISFIATSLIGLACMLFFYLRLGTTNWIVLAAFLALLLPCLFIIFFSPNIPDRENLIIRAIHNVITGWNLLKKDLRFILLYTILIVIQLMLSAWQMLIAFQAIGINTYYVQTLFLSSLGIILAFLNFTPDGIGIREAVYVFTSKLVAIPQASVVLGSLVLRAISIFTSLVIGGIGYLVLLKQLRNFNEPKKQPADTTSSNDR